MSIFQFGNKKAKRLCYDVIQCERVMQVRIRHRRVFVCALPARRLVHGQRGRIHVRVHERVARSHVRAAARPHVRARALRARSQRLQGPRARYVLSLYVFFPDIYMSPVVVAT